MTVAKSKHFEPDVDSEAWVAQKAINCATSGYYQSSGVFSCTAPDAIWVKQMIVNSQASGHIVVELHKDAALPADSATAATYNQTGLIQAANLYVKPNEVHIIEFPEPIICTSGIGPRVAMFDQHNKYVAVGLYGWKSPQR